MADEWIPIRTGLYGHPRVLAMVKRTTVTPVRFVGSLMRAWAMVDEHGDGDTEQGDAVLHISAPVLDSVVELDGFTEAMVEAGWCRDEVSQIVFVRYFAHNGPTAKQRLLSARRVSRHRAAAKSSDVPRGTPQPILSGIGSGNGHPNKCNGQPLQNRTNRDRDNQTETETSDTEGKKPVSAPISVSAPGSDSFLRRRDHAGAVAAVKGLTQTISLKALPEADARGVRTVLRAIDMTLEQLHDLPLNLQISYIIRAMRITDDDFRNVVSARVAGDTLAHQALLRSFLHFAKRPSSVRVPGAWLRTALQREGVNL